jgi:hypothetical protein
MASFAPKKARKYLQKKHLRPLNPLVCSPSILPIGEHGGFGATDNCSPRWAQD